MEGKGHQSMMDDLIREISRLAREEYQRAAAEHGGAANTPHEGYALIKEEEEEAADQMSTVIQKVKTLWWSVKSESPPSWGPVSLSRLQLWRTRR